MASFFDFSNVLKMLPRCTMDIPYSDAESKERVIEEIAELAARCFTYFLTQEAHTEEAYKWYSDNTIGMNPHPRSISLPSTEQTSRFYDLLKKRAQMELHKKIINTFLTNNSPEGLLNEVCEEAGIDWSHFRDFSTFFPIKSRIQVIFRDQYFHCSLNFSRW